VEWGGYRFEALTTGEQLLAEGVAMQHCVGTFSDYCRKGLKRIYSVRQRKTGQRVATFSVEYADDGDGAMVWRCDLLSGLKNAEVPKDVHVAADAVLRGYLDLPASTYARPVAPARTASALDDEEWCCDF
jgi:hypothetical protein